MSQKSFRWLSTTKTNYTYAMCCVFSKQTLRQANLISKRIYFVQGSNSGSTFQYSFRLQNYDSGLKFNLGLSSRGHCHGKRTGGHYEYLSDLRWRRHSHDLRCGWRCHTFGRTSSEHCHTYGGISDKWERGRQLLAAASSKLIVGQIKHKALLLLLVLLLQLLMVRILRKPLRRQIFSKNILLLY